MFHIDRQDQYLLQLTPSSTPFPVLCVLHHQLSGDNWLVIQQRLDGSENFFRNWVEYREGFGNLNREFWLGLEHIHQITTSGRHELLVEIGNFGHDHFGWARYSRFVVGDESQRFILQELGAYSGTIGDSLTPNLGKPFSTYDNDNERSGWENCAVRYKGAWWYDLCYVL
ncbi:hypothetical protein pipiens_002153 [Culex pipiens pipiens]|uniref:Fibrinogen C-terminal domain-containing protein n=1 Tax=Culex pipiens pipiens TaxID=38569 RepID=A0ABD1DLQ1_CULPP